MVSFITPPVALGAFSAATLAGANPMASAWEATRLGVVIYVIPFFFVLNPALIGQGPMPAVIEAVMSAFLGVWLLAAGMQGYLAFVGSLGRGAVSIAMRILLSLSGLLVAAPFGGLKSLGPAEISLIGVVIAFVPAAFAWQRQRLAEASKKTAD
jgi:TRAP-type uncharacterized transport system fused permease subunit